MGPLAHLTLLTARSVLLVACDSEGGGTYDGTQGADSSETGNSVNPPEPSPGSALGEECTKDKPQGAECNPYCPGDCGPEQHCSHHAGRIWCISYGALPPGANCDSSLFCEPGSACLSMASMKKTCFRFCEDDLDCGTGFSCTVSLWLEVGFESGGEFASFCEQSSSVDWTVSPECEPQCGGKECGPDSCGGFCGDGCEDDQECVDGGCTCAPETCESLGRECGNADDGCGGYIDCGACDSGEECDTVTGQCQLAQPCSGGVGTACTVGSDCGGGYQCAYGLCTTSCSSDGDCPSGVCIGAELGIEAVCALPCDSECCPGTSCIHDFAGFGLPDVCGRTP